MKAALVLLVFCVVLALVSNTEAGKGKGKGGGWGKMMKGKCKGLFAGMKDDPTMKKCKDQGKEGADGDDDDTMDNESDGGASDGDGGKKDNKKGWKGKGGMGKKMRCYMTEKGMLDANNKFQVEVLKSEISSKLSDQKDTADAINKLLDECAKEKNIAGLDFSEGQKDSWKALFECKKKCFKPCKEDE